MGSTRVTGTQVADDTLTHQDIADGGVRGSTANQGTQREIEQGTVSDLDLRDDAVIPAKLQDTGDFEMGSLALALGSAASPALRFKTDTNTGIYSSGADVLDISAGAVNIASFSGTKFSVNVNGSAAAPSIGWSDANDGLFHTGANQIGVSINGSEQVRIQSGALALQSGAVLQLVDGTAPAPGLTFAADTNTGLYRIGTDVLGVATAGTEALRVDSNQNVAIGGTTNASSVLTLTSTTKAFLPPRMNTTQRDAIVSPTDGMMIFNSTTGVINVYSGSWGPISGVETDPLSIHLNGDNSPTAAIDWNQQELQQMVVHKLASDPVSPAEGQIWYNTTDKQWKGKNDTEVVILG